jgi:hypothetical protein
MKKRFLKAEPELAKEAPKQKHCLHPQLKIRKRPAKNSVFTAEALFIRCLVLHRKA